LPRAPRRAGACKSDHIRQIQTKPVRLPVGRDSAKIDQTFDPDQVLFPAAAGNLLSAG
jgi:hypothetical protein